MVVYRTHLYITSVHLREVLCEETGECLNQFLFLRENINKWSGNDENWKLISIFKKNVAETCRGGRFSPSQRGKEKHALGSL